ncbi:MAG: hypothetical protein ABL864_15015 [Terricaulis sp.]
MGDAMGELAARVVAIFGRGASSAVIFLFGYLAWFVVRGVDCADNSSIACEAALRLSGIFYDQHQILPALAVGLCVLGVGYAIGLSQDFLFDETLRGNYNSLWSPRGVVGRTNAVLRELRQQSIRILQGRFPDLSNIRFTDYMLYEVVGGIVKTSTRQYVDEARVYGAAATTLILLSWLDVLVHEQGRLLGVPVAVVISLFAYVLGREGVKAQYRYRAIRLYSNLVTSENAS